MNPIEILLGQCPLIEKSIHYTFKERRFLVLAFIHRSFFNENRAIAHEHNERLEFLGDSILGAIVSEYLYHKLPSSPEGELSHFRSHIVDANACVNYLQKLGVAEFVLLGRGEKLNDGKGRETILADLFEALIGAIHLDGGMEAAKQFFFHHFLSDVEKALQEPLRNWKAELQDYSQKKHQKPPLYKIVKESGPDHQKTFQIAVFIEERKMGQGTGHSKKEAEQAAAEDAMQKIEENKLT